MAIELKITVNHATDLAAEVQRLAEIIGGSVPPLVREPSPVQTPVGKVVLDKMTDKAETPVGTASLSERIAKAEKAVEDSKKTLNRKEQDEAVVEMIKAGAKDDRFDMLTKGRQNEVEEALTKPVEKPAEVKKDDVDDMFSDDAPAAKTVSRDDVANLMAKVAKDKDGNQIQEKALKIRAVLVDNIPEGQEIKVRNIPEDKLATVYAAIEKIGK